MVDTWEQSLVNASRERLMEEVRNMHSENAALQARLAAVTERLNTLKVMVNDTMAHNWPNVTIGNVRIHVRGLLAAAQEKDGTDG